MLIVIEGAFADPGFVEFRGDRQPRTALLVLKYLDLSTNDVSLKKRIADPANACKIGTLCLGYN